MRNVLGTIAGLVVFFLADTLLSKLLMFLAYTKVGAAILDIHPIISVIVILGAYGTICTLTIFSSVIAIGLFDVTKPYPTTIFAIVAICEFGFKAYTAIIIDNPWFFTVPLVFTYVWCIWWLIQVAFIRKKRLSDM